MSEDKSVAESTEAATTATASMSSCVSSDSSVDSKEDVSMTTADDDSTHSDTNDTNDTNDTTTPTSSNETSNETSTEITTEEESVESFESEEELMKKVIAEKTLGNAALLSSSPTAAITHYTNALTLLNTNTNTNTNTNITLSPSSTTQKAILYANRAQAYIVLENYGLAILDASDGIQTDSTYPKGFYRRGTAHLALQKYKSAKQDFKKVCILKPKDKDARAKFSMCDKLVKEAAFAKAIMSEEVIPLSQKLNVNRILMNLTGYDGPHPSLSGEVLGEGESEIEEGLFHFGNLPLKFVIAAIARFKDQKLIHKRYVARLLINSKKYFESISSLMKIAIPTETDIPTTDNEKENTKNNKKPHITICGDTHGQFYDVLNIFKINGYPSSTNPYLFNGDYVDRGSFSIEVILTFLLFKAHDPTCIYLTRGNHETKNMNKIYGFEGECKAKFDDQIMELFLEVFSWLPLAAVINDKVFVTHGGIPTTPTTLSQINAVKRGMEPPDSGIMSDLLWSDPQPFPGKSPSKRGVGYSFGPDICEAFLQQNDLSFVIRSHEVKDEGYLVEHGGKTITVFSAPNYCDSMGNKGAFIHLDDGLVPEYTQYEAVEHPEIRPMAYAAGMGGLFGM